MKHLKRLLNMLDTIELELNQDVLTNEELLAFVDIRLRDFGLLNIESIYRKANANVECTSERSLFTNINDNTAKEVIRQTRHAIYDLYVIIYAIAK